MKLDKRGLGEGTHVSKFRWVRIPEVGKKDQWAGFTKEQIWLNTSKTC